jgi:hypothetical protein
MPANSRAVTCGSDPVRLRGLNLLTREHDQLYALLIKHMDQQHETFLTVLQEMSAAQLRLTVELFALGQHHGLHTPFLDWTSVPLTALYFAFEQPDDRVDGVGYRVVFALNKTELERLCPSKEAKGPDDIMVLDSMAHDNPRIIAQSGLFTFIPAHMPVDQWVVSRCKTHDTPVLIRFLIRNKNRSHALSEMDSLNINARTVYPDRFGAALHSNYLSESSTL